MISTSEISLVTTEVEQINGLITELITLFSGKELLGGDVDASPVATKITTLTEGWTEISGAVTSAIDSAGVINDITV